MIHRIFARVQNLRAPWSGYIEPLRDGQISCWVWSRHQPEIPVEIEILFCGEVIARRAADQERRDVATALGRKIAPGCSLSLASLPDTTRETLVRKLRARGERPVLLPKILSIRVVESGVRIPFTLPASKQKLAVADLMAVLGGNRKSTPVSDLETLRKSAWFDAGWYCRHYPDVAELGMDPAMHYLRLGAMLGRNPSPAFDGEAYLKRYPQVAGKGINPLLHYEKWGAGNGYVPFPIFLKGANATPGDSPHGEVDILLSCWLGRPEDLHGGFREITRVLRDAGLTYQLLCPPGAVMDLLRNEDIHGLIPETYSVIRSPNLLGSPGKAPPLSPQIARQVIQRDMEFFPNRHFSPLQQKKLVEKCRHFYNFWRNYLVTHQVKFFLIWGNTAPTSRVFMQLCQELTIEYLVLERGHFAGTLHADMLGQFAYGASLRRIGNLTGGDTVAGPPPCPDRLAEIETWGQKLLAAPEAAPGNAPEEGTVTGRILREKAAGKPIILMMGANDQGSGLLSPELGMARLSWFGTSPAAFSTVTRIIREKFPDALLVLRPHPSQDYQPDGDDVIIATEDPLERLIGLADVCLSISSTVYALCLLANKPMLHFGAMDSLYSRIGRQICDETEILPALREIFWSGFAPNYTQDDRARHLTELFDEKLIAARPDLPTRLRATDLGAAIVVRAGLSEFGNRRRFTGNPARISKALCDDISNRARMAFTPAPAPPRRPISVVMPIYSDYVGTARAFDLVAKYRTLNDNHRVILVWDRGPDGRLLDLCREAVGKYGFELLENAANIGFSGSVNRGIDHAGRDDVILLNSDTVVCDDWALRLSAAACASAKLAAVVPFSNNATIFNLPFPEGRELPQDAEDWVRRFDLAARGLAPCVMEMPVAHGFCTYIRREAFDRVGLFDEMAFGIGQGEDNDFSLRLRGAGYFLGCATNVFVGHDGGTSFGEEAMGWKISGRKVMNAKYPHYMDEIRAFLADDPLAEIRRLLIAAADSPAKRARTGQEMAAMTCPSGITSWRSEVSTGLTGHGSAPAMVGSGT